jgi:hypothetical protein
VELYHHSSNTPSWRGAQLKRSAGTILPLHFKVNQDLYLVLDILHINIGVRHINRDNLVGHGSVESNFSYGVYLFCLVPSVAGALGGRFVQQWTNSVTEMLFVCCKPAGFFLQYEIQFKVSWSAFCFKFKVDVAY